MAWICKECGSKEIELERITPFESKYTKYTCQNCGNNAYYIENIAELEE